MARANAKAERREFDEAMVAGFAAEYVAWRLGGCPGFGFQKEISARMTKAARRHGRSYSELWAEVHRAAYAAIDSDPRARLATQAG